MSHAIESGAVSVRSNPLTQRAEDAYFAGLRALTAWSQEDQRRSQRSQADSPQHLLAGIKILLQIGGLAQDAVDAFDLAPKAPLDIRQSRFSGAVTTVGALYDKLSARLAASQNSSARAC
jgi:hypothetical protein